MSGARVTFPGGRNRARRYQASHMFYSTGRTISPLEVELNGSLWMPASIAYNADNAGADPLHRGSCRPGETGARACTNWTRVQGWSSVVGMAPTAIPIGCGDLGPGR